MHIRLATEADIPDILTLIHALAVYEREPDAVQIGEAELRRDGFGPQPLFECLIADDAGVESLATSSLGEGGGSLISSLAHINQRAGSRSGAQSKPNGPPGFPSNDPTGDKTVARLLAKNRPQAI